jgi:predicted anti-sigma-YlaC factor YlaD
MAHYDYIEWLLYKNKALSDNKMKEMEEHLYNCENCLDIFLTLIDDQEVEHAEKIVPLDFTAKVLKNISQTEIKSKPRKAKGSVYYNTGYYAAVAAVTVFLTIGGFYTNLVDAVPKISASVQQVDVQVNLVADLSNKIIKTTSDLLLSIERNKKIEKNK